MRFPKSLAGYLVANAAALAVAMVAPPAAADDPAMRGVPYLTNRAATGDSDPSRHYGDDRGTMEAGFCGISEVRLDFLSGVAQAAPFHVPEEILRVDNLRPGPESEVFDRLAADVGDGRVLMYTHGFYIDFEKGCRRATVLQESAGLSGRFLWFSWPSDGSLFNYTRDESDLYWSVLDLSGAIIRLADRFGPGRVNLAGHSLGGRGMVMAIHDVAAQRPDVRLGDVVLLAPDMDFDIFLRLLPRIRPVVRSITVYVADGDRPLALSEQVHGYPRLGQSGNDVARLEGVEVIDLSDLQVRSPTGHLYHVYNGEVGADMDQLLNGGLRAADRRNMVQVAPNLWRLQPGG